MQAEATTLHIATAVSYSHTLVKALTPGTNSINILGF
jgi:hypothetical protein